MRDSKVIRSAIKVVVVLLAFGPIKAFSLNGGDIVANCPAGLDANKATNAAALLSGVHCVGYVRGLNDAVQLNQRNSSEKKFCEPQKDVSSNEIVRIFVNWLQSHPESTNLSAATSFLSAMKASFPCSGSGSGSDSKKASK